ncbi:collagen-like protein [Clostridium rectalis]|uniref:collagen-like protein n=1 Tax=Clostridium rectalis TaxID=2040295 RepID=UPI000F641408|nr:collagen-like protein [Clostridium rectalis]
MKNNCNKIIYCGRCTCPGGVTGPTGARGITGPTGIQGITGATGITGPGVTPAYFNAVTNGGSQDVPPGDEVIFTIAFQSGDFTFAPNSSTITVNTGGIYRIDYTVTIRPNNSVINAAFAVTINGFEHPLSFFGIHSNEINDPDTKRAELNGMFIASIPDGATITLKNKSATVNLLAGTGIDNQAVNRSSIILQRID